MRMLIAKAVLPDGFSIRLRLQTYTPAKAGGFSCKKSARHIWRAIFLIGEYGRVLYSVTTCFALLDKLPFGAAPVCYL